MTIQWLILTSVIVSAISICGIARSDDCPTQRKGGVGWIAHGHRLRTIIAITRIRSPYRVALCRFGHRIFWCTSTNPPRNGGFCVPDLTTPHIPANLPNQPQPATENAARNPMNNATLNFDTYAVRAFLAQQIRISVLRGYITKAHGDFGHDFKKC